MKPSFYNLRDIHSGIIGAFFFAIFLIVPVSHSMAGITTVTIHKRSTVIEEKILLGEISEIRGEDQYFNQKLASIVIGRSPQPDKSRYIDEKYIQIRLRQNKIDPSQVNIHCPDKIEVYRDYIEVSKDEIKKIMFAYINKNIPWDKDSSKIKMINIPSDLILPKGNVAYHVTPLKHWNYMGRGSMPVIFKVNNTFEKKIWVTVEVDVFGDVVISPGHLGKSKIVSKEDVCLETRNLACLPRNTIARLEDVIGKRTKRAVDANSVITTDMLDLPPVVRRGDLVTLIAETDALKITTLGEVRESAIKGETIRILNVASKKEIYGKVLDSSTVKVEF